MIESDRNSRRSGSVSASRDVGVRRIARERRRGSMTVHVFRDITSLSGLVGWFRVGHEDGKKSKQWPLDNARVGDEPALSLSNIEEQ
jgi:hypothetical protein